MQLLLESFPPGAHYNRVSITDQKLMTSLIGKQIDRGRITAV